MTSRKKGRGPKPARVRRVKQSDVEAQEIEELSTAIQAGKPPPGANPLKETACPPQYSGVKLFEDLPLSRHTRRALADNKFTHLTAIQRASLPHSLCGRDILGAAKTGSGKTLAFLIPVRCPHAHKCSGPPICEAESLAHLPTCESLHSRFC
jgi:ATP-dependent RNA helicase DDX10/DBP4